MISCLSLFWYPTDNELFRGTVTQESAQSYMIVDNNTEDVRNTSHIAERVGSRLCSEVLQSHGSVVMCETQSVGTFYFNEVGFHKLVLLLNKDSLAWLYHFNRVKRSKISIFQSHFQGLAVRIDFRCEISGST